MRAGLRSPPALAAIRSRFDRLAATQSWSCRLAAAALLVLGAGTGSPASGTEVMVIGLFPGKAVLSVDGGAPKTYAIGARIADDIRLVGVNQDVATIVAHGKTSSLPIGSYIGHATKAPDGSVTLQADARGHYIAQGAINGGTVQMLVDTGATLICLPATEARRLGIEYRNGQPSMTSTANGTVAVYRIKLDKVTVGSLELAQVDAVVQETGLSVALLGMSFLSRTDMNRSGTQLTLTKRN